MNRPRSQPLRWPLPATRLLLAVAVGLAGLAAAQPSTGSYWKWREANGRITVSDQPPPREIPERDILERPAPRPSVSTGARQGAAAATGAAAPGAAPARAVAGAPGREAASAPAPRSDPELEARRRAEQARAREAEQAAAAPDPQALARRRENCERARATLAAMESGQRLARLNDKGERVVLDDATRAQETRRARDVIASDCL
ncbi:MAG: DUF4124 domain-containing protein [Rubrivivax sp.]